MNPTPHALNMTASNRLAYMITRLRAPEHYAREFAASGTRGGGMMALTRHDGMGRRRPIPGGCIRRPSRITIAISFTLVETSDLARALTIPEGTVWPGCLAADRVLWRT